MFPVPPVFRGKSSEEIKRGKKTEISGSNGDKKEGREEDIRKYIYI